MITNLIKAGFGHSVRFIALVESIRSFSNEKISYISPDCMHSFIASNVSQYHCQAYSLDRWLPLVTHNHLNFMRDKKDAYKLASSDIVVDDFFLLSKLGKLFSSKTISCGLYHGDIQPTASDSPYTLSYKQNILKKASQHDIFFHINLKKPHIKYNNIKSVYVPVPLVCRKNTLSVKRTKHILGLSPDEKFILIHAGAATTTNVYRELYKFYTCINQINIPYRIVIAHSIENHDFPFRSGIIKAPLFNNGIDLVNASELVISKPGMGILQDCIATCTPLLLTPADSTERQLKIDLLNKLLSNNVPVTTPINADAIKECVNYCLLQKNIYDTAFKKVPTNGADLIAKTLIQLKKEGKKNIKYTLEKLKKENPFL